MNPLPPLLARSEFPWTVLIFFIVVAIQVAAGIWQQLRRKNPTEPMPSNPDELATWLGRLGQDPGTTDTLGRRIRPSQRPTPRLQPELDPDARARRLEQQLRGEVNWRAEPPPLPAAPDLPQPREFAPPPSEPLASLDESAAALAEARQRLAYADALSTAGVAGLHEAGTAIKHASKRLVAAEQSVFHPHPIAATTTAGASHSSGLPAQLHQTLRDPASARGVVITALLLGRPKALED